MNTSKFERINAMAGAILAVVGLLSAIGELTVGLGKTISFLDEASPLVIIVVSVVVLLVAVHFVSRGRSRKSRLRRPEVLLIDPTTPRT